MRGNVVGIEINQRITFTNLIADLHPWAEPLSFQLHGVQTDVHQHLDAVFGREGHGMRGRVQLNHASRTWRHERGVHGIDRDPVAHHLLRENRVRDLIDWHEHAGERRTEQEMPHVRVSAPAKR
jgi:hypothetical protein